MLCASNIVPNSPSRLASEAIGPQLWCTGYNIDSAGIIIGFVL